MRLQLISIIIILFTFVSCNDSDSKIDESAELSTELSQADRDQIIATFMATKDAWNKGDLVEFMKGYQESDDIAFVGAKGPVYGYDATLERYQKSYPDLSAMGQLEFEVLRLQKIDSRTAQMIGKFYLTRTIGDMQGYYTLVWQKFGDKWLIISDHSSGEAVE